MTSDPRKKPITPAEPVPVTRAVELGTDAKTSESPDPEQVESPEREPVIVVGVPHRDPELAAIDQIEDTDEKTVAIVALFMKSLEPYREVSVERRKEIGYQWALANISLEEISAWVAVGVDNPRRATELRSMGLSPSELGSSSIEGGPTIGRLYNSGKINIDTACQYVRRTAGSRRNGPG